MKARFAEWLAKPRYWAAYMLVANFMAFALVGIGVFALHSLFTVG